MAKKESIPSKKEREVEQNLETSKEKPLEVSLAKKENSNKEIATREKDKRAIVNKEKVSNPAYLNRLNILDHIKDPAKLFQLAETLVGGKLCPFKEPQDVMIALMAGKELGIGLIASLNGIYPIEGRASLGVHLKKGILLSNNIIFEKIYDYEPMFQFVETDKDGKVVMTISKDKEGNDIKIPSIVSIDTIDNQPPNTKKSKNIVDYISKYKFIRFRKIYGEIIKTTAYGEFTYSDAQQADLLKKANYKGYIKDMLSARAFSRGSNEIADDLLQGMLSPSEMIGINNKVNYTIDEEGREIILSSEKD